MSLLNVTITGTDTLKRYLPGVTKATDEELEAVVSWATELVYREALSQAEATFTRAPGLMRNRLRMAIDAATGRTTGTVEGEPGTSSYQIVARGAHPLAFYFERPDMDVGLSFFWRVMHPPSPTRTQVLNLLRDALEAHRVEIIARFHETGARVRNLVNG